MMLFRGGSKAAATSKMEHFVIIVNGWKPLTIITKRSILDVAAVLDPLLLLESKWEVSVVVSKAESWKGEKGREYTAVF